MGKKTIIYFDRFSAILGAYGLEKYMDNNTVHIFKNGEEKEVMGVWFISDLNSVEDLKKCYTNKQIVSIYDSGI